MKGLIYKDLVILYKKASKINMIIVFVIPIIMSFIFKFKVVTILSILVPFMFAGLSYNLFIEDEKCNWEKYIRILPLDKKKLVISRYISSIVVLCVSIIYMIIVNLIIYVLFREQTIVMYFIILGIGSVLSYIYLIIFVPANYFLGANSKNVVGTIFMILVAIIVYLIKQYFSDYYISIIVNIPIYIYFVINIIVVVLFSIISFCFSLYGFERKKIY